MRTNPPLAMKQGQEDREPEKAGMLYVYDNHGHLILSEPYYKTPEGVIEVEKA